MQRPAPQPKSERNNSDLEASPSTLNSNGQTVGLEHAWRPGPRKKQNWCISSPLPCSRVRFQRHLPQTIAASLTLQIQWPNSSTWRCRAGAAEQTTFLPRWPELVRAGPDQNQRRFDKVIAVASNLRPAMAKQYPSPLIDALTSIGRGGRVFRRKFLKKGPPLKCTNLKFVKQF